MFTPNKSRMQRQMQQNMMQYAGQTATWWRFVSASTGNPAAGYGAVQYSAAMTITAQFTNVPVMANVQQAMPGGYMEAGDVRMISNEKMGSADQIVWNSVRYRVDTVSQPSILDKQWVSILKRGDK